MKHELVPYQCFILHLLTRQTSLGAPALSELAVLEIETLLHLHEESDK